MDVLNDITLLFTILALVVLIFTFIILWSPVKNYLKGKMDESDYETLIKVATTGVRWAEQWLTGYTGAQKKTQVVEYVTTKAFEYGLLITADDIDKVIERAVMELKKESENNGI